MTEIANIQNANASKHVAVRMTPIDRETYQEQSYRKLRDALMKGRFMPGDVVSLRSLASELGTSPMPIREAVRRLIAEGALELRQNRTFAVPVMTRAKLHELRHLRLLLEGEIAEKGGRNIDSRDLAELHGLNDEMKSALLRGDSKRYLTKNQDFHFILYRNSGMNLAVDIIEMIWLRTGPSFNLMLLGDSTAQATFLTSNHDDVLDAIHAGNPKAVRTAIQKDVEEGMGFLIDRTTE